jgi:asparagine N-glycosylation enzyme membrane subunit Stt3
MDIDFYHLAGWLLAIGLTVYGFAFTRPTKRTVPFYVLAALALVVGAGQHGGLAVVEPRWHNERYLFGFFVTLVGLILWAIAFRNGRDRSTRCG